MWELTHKDKSFEYYTIRPRDSDDPEKVIKLRNNRPLIHGKYKIMKRPVDWEHIGGKAVSKRIIEMIGMQIMSPELPPLQNLSQYNATPKPYNRKKGKDPGPSLGDRK